MVDRKHKGAHSELIACRWLLEQGFEVFRNVSAHGYADIIAWSEKEVLRIDVKTAFVFPTNPEFRPGIPETKKGISLLWVLPDGSCELDRNPRIAYPRLIGNKRLRKRNRVRLATTWGHEKEMCYKRSVPGDTNAT